MRRRQANRSRQADSKGRLHELNGFSRAEKKDGCLRRSPQASQDVLFLPALEFSHVGNDDICCQNSLGNDLTTHICPVILQGMENGQGSEPFFRKLRTHWMRHRAWFNTNRRTLTETCQSLALRSGRTTKKTSRISAALKSYLP